jgi:dolichyldiphosphatase
MAYFATFLVLHLHFRHRFTSSGSWVVDKLIRLTIHVAFISWAGVVAYSRYAHFCTSTQVVSLPPRYHLVYHSSHQIFWGLSIGIVFAVVFYAVTEHIPTRRPNSYLGQIRTFALANPVSKWLRLRDGWAIWSDSGLEESWQIWWEKWEESRVCDDRKDR